MHHSSGFRFIDSLNGSKRQGGATAIEFAIAFPVFFALLYAVLMYGFIFLAELSLQHAAEDGARAALRYPGQVNNPGGNGAAQTELSLRQANANTTAQTQISWLPAAQRAAITTSVGICSTTTNSCTEIDPSCSLANAYTTRCQVVVTLQYAYRNTPLIPPLPGFGLLVPDSLSGSARVLLDGRALSVL